MSRDWVEEVLDRCRLGDSYRRQRALVLWQEVVGERLAGLTRAARFARGTLWVEVRSPAAAQELGYVKEECLRRLNERLGEDAVREVHFVPGRFDASPEATVVRIDAQDESRARSLFQEVGDPALRAGFERLYVTLARRERSLLAAGGRACPECGVVFVGLERTCPGCRMGGIAQEKRKD